VNNGVFSIPFDTVSTIRTPRKRGSSSFPLRQYIGCDENRLVREAVEAVCGDSRRYNPLVLFGPTGTGKSLLAHGIARRWTQQHPGTRIISTTGVDFAREYAGAVETDALEDFRRKYRRTELLVIDDLHEMDQKVAAQKELILTLDTLLEHYRRVLVTLPHAPAETVTLLPGLASRLSAGLTVPLVPPGAAARRLILQRLADARGASLPEPVIDVLLTELPTTAGKPITVPLLMQRLIRLEQLAADEPSPINESLARRCLLFVSAAKEPQLRSITKHVCKYFKIRLKDLKGPARQQRIVRARGVAMLLARRLTGNSLEQVGHHFGNRDHTTVLHACRKTESLIKCDASIRQAFEELATQLGGTD
jgi:chromosomal replication initiator protein